MDYKDTLNLPSTSFSMKADLVRREPQFLKAWDEIDIYRRIREKATGNPRFLLHDGPPYASGDIHIGTGLNKVLKDFVVRYKTMTGHDAPFVPGWDCHGLPIEHRVMTELGEKARTMDKMEIRRLCRNYALKFVERHKKLFRALGGIGDWENPYLTLKPEYEAGVIDIFADLASKGYVYKSLKPIHWCITCRTALAEAELEYQEDESPSIFVRFRLQDDISALFPKAANLPAHVLIWTTTPWTLPANLAVAMHPNFDYAAVKYTDARGEESVLIMAAQLVDDVMRQAGISTYEVLSTRKGSELAGLKYKHCLLDKTCSVLNAEFVTLTDTGCVHSAPGHGDEDYRMGLEHGLEIFSPVDESGVYTAEAGEFKGLRVFDANPKIIEKLKEKNLLLHASTLKHSYPHCWRCKEPVIFRATEQWFVSVSHEDLRGRMLKEIARVNWLPGWGQSRIRGMVDQRPDWCISRQRTWGIPIPAFYCEKCGQAIIEQKTIGAVRDLFAQKGSDSWFKMEASEILPAGYACPKCSGTQFRKETDIFDVWFESGSSHRAVCKQRQLGWPADLYLEGTDQHRGWFQLSLLTATAADGKAPFETVLTHGFVVDERGEKMSKSLGNFISVDDMLKRFGADIFRLWVSSVDYRQDINLSFNIIDHLSNGYRRIRNTFRYLLGNLSGFDPATGSVDYAEMPEIDRWALGKTQRLLDVCRGAYENYEFHRVYHLVHNFCAVEMSSFYMDILKDRLYASPADSVERRSAQNVMRAVLDVMVTTLAPILVYTVQDVWTEAGAFLGGGESPHLRNWPDTRREWLDSELEQRWEKLIAIRNETAREIERVRKSGEIRSSLEAAVKLHTEDTELRAFLEQYSDRLPEILIVSEFSLEDKEPRGAVKGADIQALNLSVSRSKNPKCERCWNLRADVGRNEAYPDICGRCAEVMEATAKPH